MRSVFCVFCLAATVGALRINTAALNDDVEEDTTDACVADVMALLRVATRRLTEASGMLNATANRTNVSTPKIANVSKNTSAHSLTQNVSENLKKQQQVLDSLFAHLKQGISKLNSRETSNKESQKDQVAKLEERVAEDHLKANRTNLTTFERELLVNRTRMDEQSLQFFSRGRALEHNIYHANLKVNHALMSRVKMVMDAYKGFMKSGKLDAHLADSLKGFATGLPSKELIQVYQEDHRQSQKQTAI